MLDVLRFWDIRSSPLMLAFKNKRTKETSNLRNGHYSEGACMNVWTSHTEMNWVCFLEKVVLEGWMDGFAYRTMERAVTGSEPAPQPQGRSVTLSPPVGKQIEAGVSGPRNGQLA